MIRYAMMEMIWDMRYDTCMICDMLKYDTRCAKLSYELLYVIWWNTTKNDETYNKIYDNDMMFCGT